MSLETQAKLLRILQEKSMQRLGGGDTISTDVRIIAATNRNLEEAIQQKVFRKDLYYRLNSFILQLPRLQEKTEDIPALAHYFLQRHAPMLGSSVPNITPEALKLLQDQSWPGNVRQLENVIREVILESRGFTLTDHNVRQALGKSAAISVNDASTP